jgi:hypothetical protein
LGTPVRDFFVMETFAPKMYRLVIEGRKEPQKIERKGPYGKRVNSKKNPVFKEGLFKRIY